MHDQVLIRWVAVLAVVSLIVASLLPAPSIERGFHVSGTVERVFHFEDMTIAYVRLQDSVPLVAFEALNWSLGQVLDEQVEFSRYEDSFEFVRIG